MMVNVDGNIRHVPFFRRVFRSVAESLPISKRVLKLFAREREGSTGVLAQKFAT